MSFQNCSIVCAGANPAQYHAQEVERGSQDWVAASSMLREFMHCPSRWRAGYESPESQATRYGSLFDCLHLTPDQFDKRYVVRPATYTATGMECPKCKSVTDSGACRKCGCARVKVAIEKEWNNLASECAEWRAEREKQKLIVISPDEMLEAATANKRLLEDEIIKSWWESSDKQVWVRGFWKDERTGLLIPVRCLIDYVPRADTEFCKCAGDLKTARSAARGPFKKWCIARGYYIQAAWNTDLLAAATGEDRNTFCLVVSENYPPYQPGRRMIDQELMMLGRSFYTRAMARYAQCLKSGQWPGYDDDTQDPENTQGWSLIRCENWMAMEEASQSMESDQRAHREDHEPELDAMPDEIIP